MTLFSNAEIAEGQFYFEVECITEGRISVGFLFEVCTPDIFGYNTFRPANLTYFTNARRILSSEFSYDLIMVSD